MTALRTMVQEDIPAGLALCRAAGWNQRAAEWELFLTLSPDDCRVAFESKGNVVGTVTTVCYEDHFSWIGMLLVDPSQQRRGIGTQLLQESLDILRETETVKLDATPQGREVYLKLDFVDEYPLSRMKASSVAESKLSERQARPINESDFHRLLEFDREVFGADRGAVLRWLWNEAAQYAFITEEDNRISGYCFGRPGNNYTHIGPIIATDVKYSIDLASTVLRHCIGHNVILDVLHHTPQWQMWLASAGFIEQRAFIRMYRGPNAWPGVPEKQFAVVGPEFG